MERAKVKEYTRKLLADYGAKSIDEVYRMGIKNGKQDKVEEVTEHIAMLVTADMVSAWAYDNIKMIMSEVEAMKQNDFMQGRNEGMRLALTIAERDGIDGLRKELKYRGITGLNLNVSHKEMHQATEYMRQSAFDTMRIFVIGILMDRYGFGKKRVFEFIDHFNEGCTLLDNPEQWQEMKDKVNDYIGCDLIVRWNDQNGKIHAGE